MTITNVLEKFLEDNFQNPILVVTDKDNVCIHEDPGDAIDQLKIAFIIWARTNVDEECQDPISLFNYCMKTHDFGGICTIYEEDYNGDFIKYIPLLEDLA